MHLADAPGRCTWLGYPDSGIEAIMETIEVMHATIHTACSAVPAWVDEWMSDAVSSERPWRLQSTYVGEL
jgi:hypothetical protein